MLYAGLVQFSPSAHFGVPDGDKIVYPVDPTGKRVKVNFPSFDPSTGKFTTWGTLSRFRPEEDAIDLEENGMGIKIHFTDNFAEITFVAGGDEEAWITLRNSASFIAHFLTFETGEDFSFEAIKLARLDANKSVVPKLKKVGFAATIYDLNLLLSRLKKACEGLRIQDKTLSKALLYFSHGIYLRRTAFEPTTSLQDYRVDLMLYSESFLSLWKSLTVIIGDTSKKDNVNHRISELGFGATYFSEKIEPLRKIRNNRDVAHYDIDVDSAIETARLLPKLIEVTTEVINRYIEYRRSTMKTFDPVVP